MATELDLAAASGHAALLGSAGERLQRAGFNERSVCAWFGVPLTSDVRFVRPDPRRPRRGIGGWIALLVAGETVPAEALGVLWGEELAALIAIGWLSRDGEAITARVSVVPLLGALIATDRLDDHSPLAVGSPDLSAWNLAACLPRAESLLDVGTGAGAAAIVAARRGARVVATDIDPRALAMAQVNALVNRVTIDLRQGDLFAGVEDQFAAVVFNAPLARAAVAAAEGGAPLYLHAPAGEELIGRFLAGAGRHLAPRGEVLCHSQLTPAIDAAAERSGLAQRLAIHFASAADGTPHALTLLRDGYRDAARVRLPLGPACPTLHRELIDRLTATRDLLFAGGDALATAVLRPPPWLQLARVALHDGRAFRERETRLGAHRLDEAELALLLACGGATVAEIAADEATRAAVRTLIHRGLLVA